MRRHTESDRSYVSRFAKKIMAVNLLGGKCKLCGNENIIVLEFHHLKDKKEAVSTMLMGNFEKIKKEIKKCRLLCGNCHSLLQRTDPEGRNVKGLLKIKGGEAKCSRCGEKNYLFFCFHHRNKNTKKHSVNRMHVCKEGSTFGRRGKFTEGDIRRELKKCDILCRNCHLIVHSDNKRYLRLKSLIDFRVLVYKQAELNKNKDEEIKIKNSDFRKMLSKYLRVWRKTKCVKKTSDIFGINYFQLRIDLFYSRVFTKLIIRKNISTKEFKSGLLIPLTQNQVSVVDEEDYEWLSKYKWCAHQRNNGLHAVRTGFINGRCKTISMSRSILERYNGIISGKLSVTYLNKNGLDNRKCNLKIVTSSGRQRMALVSIHKKRKVEYKWVQWDSNRGKWMASMKINNRYVNFGRFKKEEFSAYVADREYIRHFHSSDNTNFKYTKKEIEQEETNDFPPYLFPKDAIKS